MHRAQGIGICWGVVTASKALRHPGRTELGAGHRGATSHEREGQFQAREATREGGGVGLPHVQAASHCEPRQGCQVHAKGTSIAELTACSRCGEGWGQPRPVSRALLRTRPSRRELTLLSVLEETAEHSQGWKEAWHMLGCLHVGPGSHCRDLGTQGWEKG